MQNAITKLARDWKRCQLVRIQSSRSNTILSQYQC